MPNTLKMLLKEFGDIKDFRSPGRCQYSQADVLGMALIGTGADCFGWDEIRDFAVCQRDFIMSLMPGLPGIPSADTFARIAAKMNVRRFDRVTLYVANEFLDMATPRGPGRPRWDAAPEVIAIDGKTLRGSGNGNKRRAVHIVNVICRDMVILCVRVPEKSNEIGSYEGIINSLNQHSILKGRVVTADALGCQVKAAEHLTSLGSDYLFGLKGNAGLLATEHVPLLFGKGLVESPDDFIVDTFESGVTKEHGRIESRTATVIRLDALNPSREERAKMAYALEWLPSAERWPDLKAVLRVERRKESTSSDESSTDVRFFITSLALSAEQLLRISIKHWTVETRHSILDGAQAEDKCKIYRGNAPEVLSILRKLVGNLILLQSKLHNESNRDIMKLMRMCPDYLKAILTLPPKKVGAPEDWRQAMGATRRAIVVPKLAVG